MKLLLATLCLLTPSAFASPLLVEGNWQSYYSHENGRLSLSNGQGSTVTLTIDPNRCSLNLLGEPDACTEIGPMIQDYELTQVFASENRVFVTYRLVGSDFGVVAKTQPKGNLPIRLVKFAETGQVVEAIPLQQSEK